MISSGYAQAFVMNTALLTAVPKGHITEKTLATTKHVRLDPATICTQTAGLNLTYSKNPKNN